MKICVPEGYEVYGILQKNFSNVEFIIHESPQMHITEMQLDELLDPLANKNIYKYKSVIFLNELSIPYETGGLRKYVFIKALASISNHPFIPYNLKIESHLKKNPLLKLNHTDYIEDFLIEWYTKIQGIIMKNIHPDFIIDIITSYPGNILEFIIHISNKLSQIKFDYSYGTKPEFSFAHSTFFSQSLPPGSSTNTNSKLYYSKIDKILPMLYKWYIDLWPTRTSGIYQIPSPAILNIKHRFNVSKESNEFIEKLCEGLDEYRNEAEIFIFLNAMFSHNKYLLEEIKKYTPNELQYMIENDDLNIPECSSKHLVFENEIGSVYLTDRKSIRSYMCIDDVKYYLPSDTPFLKDAHRRVILNLKKMDSQFINNGLFLAILRMYANYEIKFPDTIIPNSTSTVSPEQLRFSEDGDLYTSYKMSPEAKTLSFLINNNIRDGFLSFAVKRWFCNKTHQNIRALSSITIQGKYFSILQPFIDIYWDICKDLIKKNILVTMSLPPREFPPKIIIATLSGDYKGYYDIDNHCIVLNDIYHPLEIKDILLNKSQHEFTYLFKNDPWLRKFFSCVLPIPTLIHELLHAIQISDSTSHGFTKILQGNNLSFDDCALGIYHTVLKNNIIDKYFYILQEMKAIKND